MGNVTVKITTVDDQAIPVPINDVLVQIFDETDVYITEGQTGVVTPGEVEFTLFGDTPTVEYIVRLSKVGFSFPPAPTFTIDVEDPAPVNEFSFTGHDGATEQVVKLSSQKEGGTPGPVPGTQFRVHDELDSFITELVADLNGDAELVLPGSIDPGTVYIVRMRNAGWEFSGGPTQQIQVIDPLAVDQTNEFLFPASQPELPESLNPDMCLLSGTFVDVTLRPLKGVTIRFMPLMTDSRQYIGGFPGPSRPTLVAGKHLIREASVNTDPNGYAEVLLPRGGVFQVHIYGLETPGPTTVGEIVVPDAAGVLLEDVLFPYVTGVTYTPDTVSFVTGDFQEVELAVTSSDGQELDPNVAGAHMEFTSSDEAVVTVCYVGGKLSLEAIGVGTATIEVARLSGTSAPRSPSTPGLVVTPLPVEVTA